MKRTFQYFLALILGIHLTSCISSKQMMDKFASLPSIELKPYGRYVQQDDQLELVSSAAHFGFTFTGKECHLYASIPPEDGHNYLQYEIDGKYAGRIKVLANDSMPVVIAAKGTRRHRVWIYKATEAHTGPIFIHKITGSRVGAIEHLEAPLIEFIGNSITCGAAADDSEVPCGKGLYHDQHNAYQAYGPRVARKLGINFTLSSVSGIGVYRNWNSDGPTMPQVFEKVDFQESGGRKWDFRGQKPDIVSMALGTNDFSGGDGLTPRLPFDEQVFTAKYIAFVQQVKSHYPSAQIVLLDSPIFKKEQKDILSRCLSAVKTSIDALYPLDMPILIHLFTPLEARGCTGHPSVADHALMAEELLPLYRALMKVTP